MRYYLIAGEASGDLHASNVIRELAKQDQGATFRCWGGDLMECEGAELVKHYRDLAFMGFLEVVSQLPTILNNFRFCEKDLLAYRPDVLILVDYPGFNLRMARFAKQHGIRVFYYISPQLWAWHASRVKTIKKWVDHMFVILPFEQAFYAGYDYKVDFQGHPLLDVINEEMQVPGRTEFLEMNRLPDLPVIALLPGSRKMEIEKMLKIMISVRPSFPGFQFVIAGAPSIGQDFYAGILKGTDIRLVTGQTYHLLSHSVIALVTSGTATLETALIGIPQVVCYRGNIFSYMIARRLVKVKFISLVNLICGKMVVPELIQQELNHKNLVGTMGSLLVPGSARDAVLEGYHELKHKLGGRGASSRVARLMIQYLTKK
ncbi:MAG: lipid-A-disaccharide synthase [Bacteroidetes bacterium]|nr:lipid-A-disaccharide synthase [Bacteroidota bacterium]